MRRRFSLSPVTARPANENVGNKQQAIAAIANMRENANKEFDSLLQRVKALPSDSSSESSDLFEEISAMSEILNDVLPG